jgi:hypothetical protein
LSIAAVALLITLPMAANGRVKRAWKSSYDSSVQALVTSADSEVAATNQDWNEWEAQSQDCQSQWPCVRPARRPRRGQDLAQDLAEREEASQRTGTGLEIELQEGCRERRVHKACCRSAGDQPRPAGHVRRSRDEDYTAMQYIGDAINVLANGGCDTTKPMDKAHEFINSAYVRIGKSLKILRSIGWRTNPEHSPFRRECRLIAGGCAFPLREERASVPSVTPDDLKPQQGRSQFAQSASRRDGRSVAVRACDEA